MKHLRYLLLAALVAMPLTACDEDKDTTDTPTTPVVVYGTVSGTVSIEGTGVAGVSVSLVGTTSQTATTSSSGAYSFANVEAGSYGVTISGIPAGATFASTSATTSITTSGQTVTVDFSGSYIRTSTIAGQVMADGMGIAGVSVTATGSEGAKSAVTDNAGSYSFSGLRAGDYTVAISNIPAAYSFATTSQVVTVGTGEAKTAGFFGTEVVTQADVTAEVVIASVTANNGFTDVPVNPAAVAGLININLTINPGQNDLTSVCVLLNGNDVDLCQTLSTSAPGEGPQMVDGNFNVQFTLNTAAFDATTGATTYANGAYVLSAVLGLEGAKESAVETSMNLTFANADTFIGEVVPTTSAIGANGFLYYGGSITANVLPVVYSGKTVSSVTVGFTGAGNYFVAAPGPFVAAAAVAVTDAAAPFSMTWSSGVGGTIRNYQTAAAGGDNFAVTAAQYSDGTVVAVPVGGIALTAGTAITVDNVAPPAGGPDYVAATGDDLVMALPQQVTDNVNYPVCCSNNWVNPAFALAGADISTATTTTRDNVALNSGGPGVGKVTTTYHMGAATLTNAQIAALPAITTVADAGLAASLLNTAYSIVAKYTDGLGNATLVRLSGNVDNAATTVGIDEQDPQSQAIAAGSQADQLIYSSVSAPGVLALGFTATEDRAGFSAEPIRIEQERLTATNSRWMVFANTTTTGGKINNPVGGATIAGCAAADPANALPCMPNATVVTQPAYYRTKAFMNDQAGNTVDTEVQRMALVDFVAPVNQNVNIPGSLVGGANATFTVPTADFDLWSGTFGFTFGVFPAGPYYPFGEEVMLGDGNRWDWSLSPTATATQTIPFVRSLETTAANAPSGAFTAASGVQFISTDAAGNQSALQQNNFAAGTVPAGGSFTAAGYGPVVTFLISNAATNLCDGTGAACAAANTKTITPTAIATGASGTFPNAFASGRVYFYWTVDANANGVVDGAEQIYLLGYANGTSATFTDTGAVRTYTYTSPVALTSADLVAKGVVAGNNLRLFAIGVSSVGDGLLAAHNAAITVVVGS